MVQVGVGIRITCFGYRAIVHGYHGDNDGENHADQPNDAKRLPRILDSCVSEPGYLLLVKVWRNRNPLSDMITHLRLVTVTTAF